MYGGTIRHTYATFFVILLCLHVQIDARTSRFTSHLKKTTKSFISIQAQIYAYAGTSDTKVSNIYWQFK